MKISKSEKFAKNIIIVKKRKKSQIFGLKKAYSNQEKTNQIRNFL